MMEKKIYIQPNVLVVLLEGNLMSLDGLSVFNKNPKGDNIFVGTVESEGYMYEDARTQKSSLWDEETD